MVCIGLLYGGRLNCSVFDESLLLLVIPLHSPSREFVPALFEVFIHCTDKLLFVV